MTRRFLKTILPLAALGALATAAPTCADQVEILRDQYGAPHVFAADNYGVYFGYGYAVAADRLYQMEILKRTVQGRAAAVLGPEFVELDVHVRTAYDLPAVRRQVAALPADQKLLLQGYADGFNKRLREAVNDPSRLPAEFTRNDFLPEPWSAYDVAMIFVGAIAHRYSDFNSELDNLQLLQHLADRHGPERAWRMFNASKWLLDEDSPTTIPAAQEAVRQSPPTTAGATQEAGRHSPPATGAAAHRPPMEHTPPAPATRRVVLDGNGRFAGISNQPGIAELLQRGYASSPEFAPASNFWAVNRTRLRDRQGVLVNGPQFGWSLPSYVYGIGLHGGDFHVVGNTLLGMPALLFAHNNHLGWGSTAGLSDQVDVFIETLNPHNPEQYLHRGAYRDFDSWTERIEVRGGATRTVTARRSVHGMVLQRDLATGAAYSRARAWEGGELETLTAWINLARARTLEEARQQLAQVAVNINFYYMDRRGNLGYTHAGRYPLRAAHHDPRLPIAGNGPGDWLGMRPYRDNPTMREAAAGYLVNWNNRPRADWISSDLWTHTWGRGDRVALLLRELETARDLDAEAVWALNRKVSDQDVSAPFLLPYLQQAMAAALGASRTERRAWALLADWDRRWSLVRRRPQPQYGAAPTIMETWLSLVLQRVFGDDIGERFMHLYGKTNNPNKPLGASMGTSPGVKILIRNLDRLAAGKPLEYDFFNGAPPAQALREAFADAVRGLTAEQGDKPARWRLAAPPMRWRPYNFRGVPQTLEERSVEAPAYMNRGSENNLFIADGRGFTAFDVTPPGQSGALDPSGAPAPHYSDQLTLFLEYGYKPIPFERREVEKLARERIVLRTGRQSPAQ